MRPRPARLLPLGVPLVGTTIAALLVGCAGDPAPTAPSTVPETDAATTSVPPVASAPPTAGDSPVATMPAPLPSPTPPPEMAQDDEAGAVAAATYFLTELYPYTISSQDTAAWEAMSHQDCIYCAGVVSAVEAEHRAGVRTTPGEIAIASTSVEGINVLAYGIKLDISAGATTQRSDDGTLATAPAERVTMGAILVWQVDQWLVRGVEALSSRDPS